MRNCRGERRPNADPFPSTLTPIRQFHVANLSGGGDARRKYGEQQ
jgi:hypothetical protein